MGIGLCDVLFRHYIINFLGYCVFKNLREVDQKYFESFKM